MRVGKSAVTGERFARGMTFEEYVTYAGSPDNLAREAWGGYFPDGGSIGALPSITRTVSAATSRPRGPSRPPSRQRRATPVNSPPSRSAFLRHLGVGGDRRDPQRSHVSRYDVEAKASSPTEAGVRPANAARGARPTSSARSTARPRRAASSRTRSKTTGIGVRR